MSIFPRDERRALREAIRMLEINPKRFILAVLFGSGAIGSGVGLGAVSAWLIARAAQLPPVLDLSIAATAVRTFGIGKAIFRYLQRIASHWVALYGMASVRTSVYRKLADSRADVVSRIRRGDLLARTGSDVDELGNVVVKALQPICVAVIVSAISVAIAALYSPLIALVLAASLIVSGIVSPLIAMKAARDAEMSQVLARSELNAHALELLENATQLQVARRADALDSQRESVEDAIVRERNRSARASALSSAIENIALGCAVVGAMWIGSGQVGAGTLSAIGLVVCTLLPLSAFEATQGLPAAAIQLSRSARSALRIMEILEPAGKSAEESTSASREPQAPTLVARDIEFGWPDHETVGGPLSLELTPGKSIAIVGPSGIGKTTLLFTLAAMIPAQKGQLTLDGVNINELDRASVARWLTLTAEDAHIFGTSILENLRVAKADLTEEQATALLDRAGLSQWLSALPEGVHTMISEGGTTVSGGEKRRLLLARALASNAPLLLLDEPAEHLDPETADTLIRDLLHAGDGERGVIVVTHRLQALSHADEVIVLGGSPAKVVARGTHAQLIASVQDYAWAVEQEKTTRG